MIERGSRTKIIQAIWKERERQEEMEGYSAEHDDELTDGSLALAAACYASPHSLWLRGSWNKSTKMISRPAWPWKDVRLNPNGKHDRKRQLVIAGALIVAEIERLERAATASGGPH